MENLPNEILLRIYKYADFLDLISLEQVSRRCYESIRSMVWPEVGRIGWHNGDLIGQFRGIQCYKKWTKSQEVGDPNKMIAVLKRTRVCCFEFNFVKDTAQDLDHPYSHREKPKAQYEYSLPLMFSHLNPSNMVELNLKGTPIQAKELIFIADTFTQLEILDLSDGSLSCAAEERRNMTESFSIFLEKFSSYGRLDELRIGHTYDSTHLNFEHIPPSLTKLDLMDNKLNSRDLSHIGQRCHQLENLYVCVHDEVTGEDVATLFNGMQSTRLRHLVIVNFYKFFIEMPIVDFSPALRHSIDVIMGDRTTTPVILRNLISGDYPALTFIAISGDTIKDEAIIPLAKLPRLKTLRMRCDEISDQAIIPIISNGILERLSVSSRYITDKIARLAIEKCKRLRELSINRTTETSIPNAEEILEIVHSVMDERYGPNERPTGKCDPRLLEFCINRDTFQCMNLHPWVVVHPPWEYFRSG
ncbi:f-box-like domain-containing protein [Ditylenchus destructor]|nr:f-box-like domain-containing protein [Ditylenchus destructor]